MQLTSKQIECIRLAKDNYITALVGGVAFGKSTTGAIWTMLNLTDEYRGEIGVICSNTTSQLNTATLRVFMDVLEKHNIIRNINYVIGKDPEPFYKYKSKFPTHENIWSFSCGSQIMTFSLEAQMRGIEASYGWADEVQDSDKEELDIITARIRGGKNPRILYTMTPPKYNPAIREMIFGDNAIPKTIATTYDNAANLPAGFIDNLKRTYSDLTFDREVMAKDVSYSENRWFYVMDDPEVRDKLFGKTEYVKGYPVILSFDFNKNPLTCLAIQKFGQAKIRVLKEYRLANSNLYNLCARIATDYGYNHYQVTGDYSGEYSDNILQEKFMTFYEKIGMLLKISDANFVLSVNPHHIDSREQCNSILSKHPDLLIDESCVFLKDDLMYLEAKHDGTINKAKDKRIGHLCDGFRYYCTNFEKEYNHALIRQSYNEQDVKPVREKVKKHSLSEFI